MGTCPSSAQSKGRNFWNTGVNNTVLAQILYVDQINKSEFSVDTIVELKKGIYSNYYVLYATLLHLSLLRFQLASEDTVSEPMTLTAYVLSNKH
jgi:hypothetical protein